MKQLGSTELKRLHREWRHRAESRLGLVLDNVQTPYNVGSILRTAAALRVDDIWLCGDTALPTHDKTRKTALGSERYLTFHEAADGVGGVTAARDAGYTVVAIELADGAQPIHAIDLSGDVCLVLGHEDRGVLAATLAACDATAFIPQLGRIGSLNVATAASIAMYEARRQAWPAES